jgi:tetratricopeptide (TPR) repeat protein
VLKINAVGLNASQHAGPIDNVGLTARLYTAPSIVWFYITKFIFPWKLATGYYWVYPSFSVAHVLLPLLADLAVFELIIYGAIRIRKDRSKSMYHAYLFFAAWAVLAVLPYIQVIPLDMTFSESWFYFSMAGLFGLIGVTLHAYKVRVRPEIVVAIVVALIFVLGVRSAVRGKDYTSQYKLAVHDVGVSKNNYSALSNISQYWIDHGQYKKAAMYAQSSINIYPVVSNYINLGVAKEYSADYPGAVQAYNQALKYGNLSIIYENLSLIYLVYSSPSFTVQFFQKAISEYPHDFKLWLYLAVFEGALGSNDQAKIAVQNATKYGTVPPGVYNNIMEGQPFPILLLGKSILVR